MSDWKNSPPRSLREHAFRVLLEYQQEKEFLTESFQWHEHQNSWDERDRRWLREVLFGIVRRKNTLQRIVQHVLRNSWEKYEPEVQTLFLLGTYQLVFLQIPSHAAIHETVELVKQFGPPSGMKQRTGLVNGVLRSVDRILSDERSTIPCASAVPLNNGQYRLLTEAIFPNGNDDSTKTLERYFSQAFSFPRWMAKRWAKRYAKDLLFQLGFASNQPSPLTLRVNRNLTNRETILQQLNLENRSAIPGNAPESILLVPVSKDPGQKNSSDESKHQGEKETSARNFDSTCSIASLLACGLVSIQDETAMHAGYLIDPQPGERILDLCAAPGTKTCHLAELMQDNGSIIACDVDKDRLKKIEENVQRLSLKSIQTKHISRSGKDIPSGTFDRILIDVPCSNTGVLGKRPEVRWRIGMQDLQELSEIQSRLLDLASQRLRKGGYMLYSTCSLEPEENQQVVEQFLNVHPEFSLDQELLTLPDYNHDGGYQALLMHQDNE